MARNKPVTVDDGELITDTPPREPRTFVMEGDPFSSINSDADIDEAFIDMQQAFQKAQQPGTLRVYKVPIDENGNALPKAQGQVYLASYAIDQYSYDELLAVIKSRFMKPGEEITVRVCASRPGVRGFVINRMITISREAEPDANAPNAAFGQLGDVLRLMQENTQRNSEMMERILTPRSDGVAPTVPKRDGVDTAIALMGALTPLLTPLIAGMMNRPKQQSDLGGMIDAVVKLKGLATGEVQGGNDDDNSTIGLVKALGPGVINAFTEIAKRQPVQAGGFPNPVPPRAIAAPRPVAIPAQRPPLEPVSSPPSAPPIQQPVQNDQPISEANPMLKLLKEQLAELISLAESGTPADAAAKLAATLIPAQYDDQLLALIETPEAFKSVLVLDPRTSAHAEWLETWRVTLLAEFEAPAEGETGT